MVQIMNPFFLDNGFQREKVKAVGDKGSVLLGSYCSLLLPVLA